MNEILLELSALFIAIFCLVDSLKKRKELYFPVPKGIYAKLKDQHFLYMILLFVLIISSVTSFLEVITEDYFAFKNTFLLYFINELYFIFHNVLAFLYVLYIINMTGMGKEKSRSFYIIFLIPFVISEILVLLNPFTGLIFKIDENYCYVRGEWLWILYAIASFYIVSGVISFFRYKKRLSKIDRTATLILISIAVFGIVIQGIWAIEVELFFESIAFLGFMLLLEETRAKMYERKGSRINRNFIIVIALIFITVIAININLIYHAGTDQTGKIGTIQLDNIKGNLQENINDAQGNLLRFSMGIEQILDSDDFDNLESYIREQKQYNSDLTQGNCFNVYAASSGWTIIPDFDMPEHYHAVERVWYTGAKQNANSIYISEPYIDAATNELCFTLSNILSDGETVAAMDFTLSKVQNIIEMMSEYEDQTALIVTNEGTIIGCTDTKLVGNKLETSLPEYMEVFDRVKASKEHGDFTTKIQGRDRIVFSNETSNGWHLILIVDYSTFYAEIYKQMIMLLAIDTLMVAVIIVFYMVSLNNQEKAEDTLNATKSFIGAISEDFISPVNNIVKTSEMMLRKEEKDSANSLRDIRESGIHLKEMMTNLVSYSNILKNEEKENAENRKNDEKKTTFSSRYIRNGIIGILVVTLLAGLVICLVTSTKWGSTRIGKEAEKYNGELTQWMTQQQSILRMFTDVISANPTVLDDYDSAVKWLNDIGQKYPDMSSCYMANPYDIEHQVIMNTGWTPKEDYRVEQRQWYIDTERSGDGYSISVPYFDAQTGLYCITFSRIVYSKSGEFLGIFGIDCYVDKLVDVLDDSYSEEGYAFLVDSDGNILNHPNIEYEMNENNCVNIEDTIYASAYHDGEVFAIKDYDGSYVSCFSKKSVISGFTVMVVQSWWSIYGSVLIMSFVFLLMLAASITAVIIMINRFIKWQEETNAKLVEAAEAAVSAGRAKSRFLAQMSHEIRTPINAVLGMNEMILRESKDDGIKEYALNIQSAGKNLLGIINSILDFSKIEEGKMEIIPVKYDTSTLIENLINSVAQRAEDKGLKFEAHIDESIPSGLYGDDVRVSQVAVNLLTNAVKYTNKGRVDLYISGERKDENTFSLGVSVKDTGIGIKQEDLGKMFESFTRLEEKRNRAIEGTGLGMSIVVRLLSMMNSKLDVKSEYGKGSEFSFKVEQMITNNKPIGDFRQKAKEAVENGEEETFLYSSKARVLIVDDNEMNLKVIKNLLKMNGIVPDMVTSGQAALEMFAGNTYNLVLLDHMMPKMDGIETLEKAKEDKLIGSETTVIALTANAVVGARETYLKAGFDDYLSKPVEVKALEEALEKYIPEELIEYRIKQDGTKIWERKIVEGQLEERRHKDRRQKERRHNVERRKGERRHNSEKPLENSLSENKAENSGLEYEIYEFMPETESSDLINISEMQNNEESKKDINEILNQNGINTHEGLNYCAGDPGFYIEILQDYASAFEERKDELDEAFSSGDLNTYAIKVHAFKGVAKTVGDKRMFELALDLEMDSKAGDMESVTKKHPILIDEYEKKSGIILDALKEGNV